MRNFARKKKKGRDRWKSRCALKKRELKREPEKLLRKRRRENKRKQGRIEKKRHKGRRMRTIR